MKKKVLFIIWSFTAGGGAEKILANILNNLDEDKYEVNVKEFIHFGVKKEYIKNNIKILKPFTISSLSNKYGSFNWCEKIITKVKNKLYNYFVYKMPKLIRKLEIRDKYDIEIAFNYMIPSILVSVSSAEKKYAWVHGSIEDLNYRESSKHEIKSVIKNCNIQKKAFDSMNNIIAISNKTEKSILDIYPEYKERVIKIYNGYDFNKIESKSKENVEINTDVPIIIAIGRLDENKNFILLIDSARILKEKGIKFNIIILGEGNERDIIENKISQYELDEYVNLKGFVDNPYPYIKKSYMLCLTSHSEGFPTVIAEGMYLGCPFISTPVAGTEELSNEGKCGLIIDYDEISLANKIELLIKDKKLRDYMSQECEEYVKKYNLPKFINRIESLL